MLCAKFGWNWSNCSIEEAFFKFANMLFIISKLSLLEKGVALHLKKLESPLCKNAKIVPSLVEVDFLNFSMYFYYFTIIPPWEGRGTSFEQTWCPLPNDALCQVCLKLVRWFWRRRWNVKNLRTDGQTDDRRSKKLTRVFNSCELKMGRLTSTKKAKHLNMGTNMK